jgi:MFS family permease
MSNSQTQNIQSSQTGRLTEEESISPVDDASTIKRRRLVLWTAVSANLLGNLGLTGINVALPSIQKEMTLGAVQVGWITLVTMLVMAMFSAPVARFSDLFGRRLLTIIGLWVSIIFSVAGALSDSYNTLFISRALVGLGLVTFFTTITTMVTEVYPKQERGRVLGLTISSVYIGLSLGPIITGFLVEWFGWRSLFWFTAVGMLPSLVLIYLVSKESAPVSDEKLALGGTLLWILAVGLGFTGLATIGQDFSLPLLFAGLALLVWFIRKSFKSHNPILDMRLFSNSRRFSFSSLAAFISYLSSTSTIFILSLYLQYSRGLSPSEAGLFLMAQPVVQALLTPLSGRLSDRYDAGKLASGGMAVIMVAIIIFATQISGETPTALLLITMGMTGAGFAFFSAPNSNAIMSAVPQKRLGQASGVITVTRLCGQISSIALTTLVFSIVIGPGNITPEKYPDFISASKICFWIFAPLCLSGILASLARGRNVKSGA